ncbi:MAG: histidine kinase [Clostridia bacterium]|nr:histidine kinase [Clostridia bacterium]
MIAYFSVAFSLVFIVFGSVLLQYNSNSFREQSYDYCRQIVAARIALIDTYFMQLQNVSRIIANDGDVIEAVAYRNSKEISDYAAELSRQRNIVNKIKQVDVLGNIDTTLIIGNDYHYLYFYGQSPRRGFDFSQTRWFMDAAPTRDLSARFTGLHDTDYLLGDTLPTVSLIAPIINVAQYDASPLGYLVCDFRLEPILEAEPAPDDIQIAIFDGETPVYFSDAAFSPKQRGLLMQHLQSGQRSFTLPQDRESVAPYIAVRESSAVSGWTILGIMPVTEIETLRNANTLFVGLLILLSISIIVLLSLLISNSVLVPMQKLLARFNAIASGRTDVDFAPTRSMEINRLSDTAQNMLQSIDRLQKETIAQQALLSREQFKVLQHQINPHLFNNTLQSIKALAVCGDTAAISRITTLLGKILSYSVYNPLDMVPLSQELNYIENYIALQQMRYPNIEYGIDCDLEAGAVFVPKLIVQPIVENAIEHGFNGVKSGRIDLCVERDGEALHIIVVDSGVGFDLQKLESIRGWLEQPDAQEEGSHIGIPNVHKRIRSIYGPEYGVSILSKPGMHTSVVITLPVKGGAGHAEGHLGG